MSGGKMMPNSHCELQKVNQVQFEVFKEKQIKEYGVCAITQLMSFVNDRPVRGGLADPRMGPTDGPCETCHMMEPYCAGHFGYLELAEPMFNIGLFDVVLTVLKCVCTSCGELMIPPNSPQVREMTFKVGVNRLREMAKLCNTKKKCGVSEDGQGGCGADKIMTRRYIGNYPKLVIKALENEQETRWHADNARAVLDKISDQTARLLGFIPERCHPRDLIITVLPIPPPQVRPAVSFGAGRSDNELTIKLTAILKENNRLAAEKAARATSNSIEEIREVLQEHVATYFHNGSTYYKPSKISNGKMTLKSITERLKGKYGRLRGNLMGKRVDFSARTVITGDPNIDVDEVGVPFSVAMTLTFPERVNAINKKRLTETVRRTNYPSANHINQHANGVVKMKRLDLVKDRANLSLNIGDIVERHVVNGDVVLFNRQPTLHRMSMMGHRVRVLNYNTFRLNLSCTTPYNADFDGDEMNLHVPQSLLTKAELIEMMMVPKNFVSPNKSAPCMGIVQDSLLGSFRLTDKETFLDKYFVQSVAMWIDRWDLPVPAILKPRPLWTGKQLFSLILPEVNHASGNNKFTHNDTSLLIRRGRILYGPIKKGIVGAAPGSLIHVIFNEKGSDEVAKFINGVQRITAYYLYNFSFSVGVQDTVADRDTLEHINGILARTREEVEGIGAKANLGNLKRRSGMTLLQSFEKEVNNALNTCRESAAKRALNNVKRTNSFKVMIEAGSKGSDLNICQIAVMVGQQNVNGSRIPFGFRRRTLPHFMQDDYGESSRGMVNRGYVEGLKPFEFFFHTMGGREGLIDTAVKTADTGYLQRKLIKALEDVHAAYDGTVRNANNDIVQLVYGEDGLDGARIEGSQVVEIPWMDDKALKDKFRYEYEEDGTFTDKVGGDYMNNQVKRVLRSDEDNLRTLEKEFRQLVHDRDKSREWLELEKAPIKLALPVNVERLIRNAQGTMGKRAEVSNLSPIQVISMVEDLQRELKQFFPSHNKGFNKEFVNIHSKARVENALKLFSMHLRTMLASKRVIKEYKLSDKAFEFLLGEIRLKYMQSMIQSGEMIGAIAAQSCGEPATQMTLNTFHNAGISSKNVTLGVPRLLELLNVSKNQRNSSMLITLVPPWDKKGETEKAAHRVEYASLETITGKIQIVYDPDPENTVVEEDKDFVRLEWDIYDQEAEQEERSNLCMYGSPWVVRLELDKDLFQDKKLTMKKIKQGIRTACNDEFFIETSQANHDLRVVRLRLRKDHGKDTIPRLKWEIPPLLAAVHLSGIRGIKKVLTLDIKSYPVNKETGEMEEKKVRALDTEGTALRAVFGGVMDDNGTSIVDFRRTSSNNIPEIYRVLGIEAARYKLFLEMRAAYVAYSVTINYRHYSVLVDTMCQRGYLMAVSRVGINRSDAGPMMRCSFEETVKVLMGAAAFGERDPVRGVSANLILGNQAKIGTGMFDLVLNIGGLKNAVSQEDAVLPGRDVNPYHGPSSVEQSTVVADTHRHRTPLATDRSVFRPADMSSVPSAPTYEGGQIASDFHATPAQPSEMSGAYFDGVGSVGGDSTRASIYGGGASSVYGGGGGADIGGGGLASNAYFNPVPSQELRSDFFAGSSEASFHIQSSHVAGESGGGGDGLGIRSAGAASLYSHRVSDIGDSPIYGADGASSYNTTQHSIVAQPMQFNESPDHEGGVSAMHFPSSMGAYNPMTPLASRSVAHTSVNTHDFSPEEEEEGPE